jgi:mannose-6-phosphate isomerase-like protein (cupin superfamily)
MAMQVRRVVTGITPDGKSVFASDAGVEGIAPRLVPGCEFHRLWGRDRVPELPDREPQSASLPYFPVPGGFRFGLFTVPSEAALGLDDIDVSAAFQEFEDALPGMAAHMEPDNPGMHTTDTVDFEYVISGRVVLELDDGAVVELGPGDTVVQNGTRHVWRNPFDEPCQMVVVLVGASRTRLGT